MNHSTIIGIDLAKTVFQSTVMKKGKLISNRRLKRSSMIEFIANTPISTIAMEACYSSHYWARQSV